MSAKSDDEMYLCWIVVEDAPADRRVQPQIIRDGIGPKMNVFSRYKLQPHEHWLPLDELVERYSLKAPGEIKE